jgi:predicted nucleotidyltransferase component of viral defense system
MTDWRVEHGQVIHAFLMYLNKRSSDYVLKGGTALLTCYHLDRFSEDIDLDGRGNSIKGIVETFCTATGYSYRVDIDTDTVKRYMIHYGNALKPLKVEVSYRRKKISPDEITVMSGIKVYNLNTLCLMKTKAYMGRDQIRDLYDLAFICNHYYDQLSAVTLSALRNAIEYKGIEQFDYIVKEQHDDLIDEGKLAEDFLAMYDKLGLFYDEEERQMMLAIEQDTDKDHS